MIKKLLLLSLLILLTGCTTNFNGVDNGLTKKEIMLAGEKVIIGSQNLGASEPKFKPEITLEKWQGETSIRIWSDEEVKDKAIEKDGKIISKTKDGKKEFNFYPVKLENNVDGFEYEIILNEKPDSNVINLNIDSTGLECYYQPELTQEEKERGNIRPDKVIGSYACYHDQNISGDFTALGGKNYMAGKAFHIYRPQMEDANGNKEWGKLKIEDNNLTVEISQQFLDNAKYPIKKVVGLVLGYDTGGGTHGLWNNNEIWAIAPYTASADGTIDKMSFYNLTANSIQGYHRAVIYNSSTAALVAVGTELYQNGYTTRWYDLTITGSLVNGTNYVVGEWLGGVETPPTAYDTVANSGRRDQITYSSTGNPDDPVIWYQYRSEKLSIYATYSASSPSVDEERKILSPIMFD